VNIKQAEKNIRNTWLLSAIAIQAFIAVSIGSLFLGYRHIIAVLYSFMPWLIGGLGLPMILIVLILTFMVYRKSRIGAILLFTVYVLDRAIALFLVLYAYAYTPFTIAWLIVSLLWGSIFVKGLRGTFVYHKLRGMVVGES
jgi:hypothetical protein